MATNKEEERLKYLSSLLLLSKMVTSSKKNRCASHLVRVTRNLHKIAGNCPLQTSFT